MDLKKLNARTKMMRRKRLGEMFRSQLVRAAMTGIRESDNPGRFGDEVVNAEEKLMDALGNAYAAYGGKLADADEAMHRDLTAKENQQLGGMFVKAKIDGEGRMNSRARVSAEHNFRTTLPLTGEDIPEL